ncbi:hypothetical protein [Blastopirellula marina]|uniref:Glycosyl hydrolases family 2 sugar binding domain-containing protein n=1 Tax=Blastopirellula marina TaxID=124 RepID=A0A2S8GTL7_9BACT|nr:hypothetical protein [Blastopirellula marina]PQO47763.1 hypothetical protein C5Y93_01590 [Blastopirellula marina]
MSQPHTIRLNGPWEMIAGLPDEPERVHLPKGWPQVVAAAQEGPVVLQRWFHRPTGIDDGSRVDLVLADLPFSGSVSVNETSLGRFTPHAKHDLRIEADLTTRCCLTISADRPGELAAKIPTPQVSLAIHPPG